MSLWKGVVCTNVDAFHFKVSLTNKSRKSGKRLETNAWLINEEPFKMRIRAPHESSVPEARVTPLSRETANI